MLKAKKAMVRFLTLLSPQATWTEFYDLISAKTLKKALFQLGTLFLRTFQKGLKTSKVWKIVGIMIYFKHATLCPCTLYSVHSTYTDHCTTI